MTDREILSNAIDKAIANGYVKPFLSSDQILNHKIEIIFSHSFAKAFFQEDKYICWNEGATSGIQFTLDEITNNGEECLIALTPQGNYIWYQPIWAYHLQQLVLCENPIKYLEKFL